jgi:hypothetical protein
MNINENMHILNIAPILLGICILLANWVIIVRWFRTRNWKPTTARIIEDHDEVVWAYKSAYPAQQAKMERSNAKSYFYRYEVEGRVYATNRLGFGGEFITQKHFRIGERVTAYYDPANPQDAVIFRNFPEGALCGLILLGVGALSLLLRAVIP